MADRGCNGTDMPGIQALARLDLRPLRGGVPLQLPEMVHRFAPVALLGQGRRHVVVLGVLPSGNGTHWSRTVWVLPHLRHGVGLPRAARVCKKMGSSSLGSCCTHSNGRRRRSTADRMAPRGATRQPAMAEPAAISGRAATRGKSHGSKPNRGRAGVHAVCYTMYNSGMVDTACFMIMTGGTLQTS